MSDSIVAWKPRIARHEAWEAYLLYEVVPLLRSRSSGGRLTLGLAVLQATQRYLRGRELEPSPWAFWLTAVLTPMPTPREQPKT